jgi:hypothetical protein
MVKQIFQILKLAEELEDFSPCFMFHIGKEYEIKIPKEKFIKEIDEDNNVYYKSKGGFINRVTIFIN